MKQNSSDITQFFAGNCPMSGTNIRIWNIVQIHKQNIKQNSHTIANGICEPNLLGTYNYIIFVRSFTVTESCAIASKGCKSSPPEVFLGNGVLKICSKFTGEHPCQSVISIKITLRHVCSPVNLLHVFRTTFYKNTSGRLLVRMFSFAKWGNSLYSSRYERKINSNGCHNEAHMVRVVWKKNQNLLVSPFLHRTRVHLVLK